MSTLTNRINHCTAQLADIVRFDQAYPNLRVYGFFFSEDYSNEKPAYINIYLDTSNRDERIIEVGDMLGRTGWTKKFNKGYNSFDWSKVICNVLVTIHSAEILPDPVADVVVKPKDWPILLKDEETKDDSDQI